MSKKKNEICVSHRYTWKQEIVRNKFFYLAVIPGIICLILFSYTPMAGLYMVFERYTFKGGLFGSEFVGLDNFRFFFRNIKYAMRATRNTLVINTFSIVLGTALNVFLAIAIDEIIHKKFKKVTQTIMLFPHFISWIVVGMIGQAFFDEERGLFNQIILAFGGEAVAWYSNPYLWWFILVFFSMWKGAGYGSLVYYSSLTGFDTELYEAAEIDGASRRQRIWYITLPMLKPTIIIMFLLQISGILAGSVDQIMGMTNLNPLLLETTDTIATFVYRSAIASGQFEAASAITLYQSIFGFLVVMISNKLIKIVEPDYALF